MGGLWERKGEESVKGEEPGKEEESKKEGWDRSTHRGKWETHPHQNISAFIVQTFLNDTRVWPLWWAGPKLCPYTPHAFTPPLVLQPPP